MKEKLARTRTEKLLLEAARIFNNTIEYEPLVEEVLRLVLTAVGCEAALIFRVDHQRTDLKFRFMNNKKQKMELYVHEFGGTSPSFVARFREPLIINQYASELPASPDLASHLGVRLKTFVSVPLIGKGQMIGVIMVFNKLEDSFSSLDLDMLVGLSNQIAVAVDNASLIRAIKREALEKNLLYEIGKKLSSSLELDDLLSEILELLKHVVPYDAGGIFLTDPKDGSIASVATVGYPGEEDERLQLKVGQGLIGTVAKSGEAVIVPDVDKDTRYIKANDYTRSEIVVPIRLRDRLIGVFNLESHKLNAYAKPDLQLLDAFASQAAISIERARMQQRIVSGRVLEQQLTIARDIQRSFLPRENPALTGYDITGRNISSGQVGGDYYDFIHIVEGQTGIAIGDVSGKGIPASLIMASFRASLIAEIRNNYSIRTICAKVNNLLQESIQPGMYVTAVYGVLDSRNHIFTFSNCGHNQPILMRANGEVELLKDGGPIFGIAPNATYDERPVVLGPGDIVMLYTDGVTEVFDKKGNEFGTQGLIDLLKKHRKKSSLEIEEHIYKKVRDFASSEHIYDDLTMIVLKRHS